MRTLQGDPSIHTLTNDVHNTRPVMVQCNPWENPVYFDGCCTHTEKIKFLLWHRVFVYTMEEVRMILYDYQLISKTFVYGILKTTPGQNLDIRHLDI